MVPASSHVASCTGARPRGLALALRRCSTMVGAPFFIGLILTAAAAAPGGQSGPTSNVSSDPGATRPLTLAGCIQPDPANPQRFTLSDKTGTSYRLTGANLKAYGWRNVRVLGGLVPSPNLAAQAGAIDPTRAAMEYQGANRPDTGKIQSIEFNVTRVRRGIGSCAPKPDR